LVDATPPLSSATALSEDAVRRTKDRLRERRRIEEQQRAEARDWLAREAEESNSRSKEIQSQARERRSRDREKERKQQQRQERPDYSPSSFYAFPPTGVERQKPRQTLPINSPISPMSYIDLHAVPNVLGTPGIQARFSPSSPQLRHPSRPASAVSSNMSYIDLHAVPNVLGTPRLQARSSPSSPQLRHPNRPASAVSSMSYIDHHAVPNVLGTPGIQARSSPSSPQLRHLNRPASASNRPLPAGEGLRHSQSTALLAHMWGQESRHTPHVPEYGNL